MAKFHSLLVKDITQETPDSVSISFEIPNELENQYNYIQGQYLTIKHYIKGEEVRRSYSFCSSPYADNEVRIAVKKVAEGKMSTFLNETLKVGDKIDVMTPMGNFYTKLDNNNAKQYVFFAGGSGITPIFSILKSILVKEPKSSISLFYGNKNKESIIFNNQLEKLKLNHDFKIINILEEGGDTNISSGLITKEKAQQLLNQYVKEQNVDEYFICGPGPMMENIKNALHDLNVNSEKIHIEYFTTVLKELEEVEMSSHKTNKQSSVTVIIDEEEFSFSLSKNGDTILDAALDNGADVPYACKGAVCCTCKGKLIKGEVKMDENYALTEQEVKDGYVLTCQSHPLSDKVIIDYDE